MHAVPINFLAVLVSAIVMMFIGFLWHGILFGKKWAQLQKFTPEQMAAAQQSGMAWRFIISFVGWLLMSFVLAHAIFFAGSYMQVSGAKAGLMAGFWNWLGFVAPVTVGVVLWEGKSWKLWLLNNGYFLISLLVMGAILGAWR